MSDWSAFGLYGKYITRRFQQYFQKGNGGVEGTPIQCQGSTCAELGTTQSGKHMGHRGGNGRWGRKVSDECEMCTENDKGSGWERQSQ
jgi:hypothetical protein